MATQQCHIAAGVSTIKAYPDLIMCIQQCHNILMWMYIGSAAILTSGSISSRIFPVNLFENICCACDHSVSEILTRPSK